MKDRTSALSEINPNWCLYYIGSAQEITEHIFKWSSTGFIVRVVRGQKMHHYYSLFDEFAAALQFPWYFGENGNAFDECISDLSWIPTRVGYVIVITHSEETLIDTEDNGLSWFVTSLARASVEWSIPLEVGGPLDRGAIPFHVVLQTEKTNERILHARWSEAGALLAPLK